MYIYQGLHIFVMNKTFSRLNANDEQLMFLTIPTIDNMIPVTVNSVVLAPPHIVSFDHTYD